MDPKERNEQLLTIGFSENFIQYLDEYESGVVDIHHSEIDDKVAVVDSSDFSNFAVYVSNPLGNGPVIQPNYSEYLDSEEV